MKHYFHVSRFYLGETPVLTPKVPDSCDKKTEGDIPRICVSPFVHHCLRSASSSVKNFKIYDVLEHSRIDIKSFETLEEYVERTKFLTGQTVYGTEKIPFVPPKCIDFRKNQEHWFLRPTKFKKIGYIDLEYLIDTRKIRVVEKENIIDSNHILKIDRTLRVVYSTNTISVKLKALNFFV